MDVYIYMDIYVYVYAWTYTYAKLTWMFPAEGRHACVRIAAWIVWQCARALMLSAYADDSTDACVLGCTEVCAGAFMYVDIQFCFDVGT